MPEARPVTCSGGIGKNDESGGWPLPDSNRDVSCETEDFKSPAFAISPRGRHARGASSITGFHDGCSDATSRQLVLIVKDDPSPAAANRVPAVGQAGGRPIEEPARIERRQRDARAAVGSTPRIRPPG